MGKPRWNPSQRKARDQKEEKDRHFTTYKIRLSTSKLTSRCISKRKAQCQALRRPGVRTERNETQLYKDVQRRSVWKRKGVSQAAFDLFPKLKRKG